MTYDLGLAETDAGWHSPLMTFATMRVLKNMRRVLGLRQPKPGVAKNGQKRINNTSRIVKINEKREESDATVFHQCNETHSETRILVQEAEKDPWAATPAAIGLNHVSREHHLSLLLRGRRVKAQHAQLKEHQARAADVARGRDDRRQRSQTPPTRSTRSRTENRSNQGASWTNTVRQHRQQVPPNVPEPPSPPRRQTGAQWLNTGAWQTRQNVPEPPNAPQTNGNTGRGYFQPPYFRQNPNTGTVEYMPGYVAPTYRWLRRPDGTWLDLMPQSKRALALWLYLYHGALKLSACRMNWFSFFKCTNRKSGQQ